MLALVDIWSINFEEYRSVMMDNLYQTLYREQLVVAMI